MFRSIVWRIMFLLVVATFATGFTDGLHAETAQKQTPAGQGFDLNRVIDPVVAKLKTPEMRPGMVGVKATIASPSKKAREHVKQGFALVHAQWDFEAYRHFCAALKEDPDCLMAYCGLTLALVQPFSEYANYRRVAVNRMLDLIEADDRAIKKGKAERFPVVEKKFATAIAALVSTDPRTAGAIFNEVAERYPKLLQARLIALFLTRGGYNVADEPSKEQRKALDKTYALMQQHPDNPMVLGFWLVLNAEVPAGAMDIKKEVLPYARHLAKKCPNVPTWQHALGHYEWRAGNYLLAERAFTRAAELYDEWMKSNGVSMNDCEGYVKAKCYLANTLYQRGDFTGAMKIAQELRALKPDPARPRSAGNQMILWRAYTLPARLYAAHGAKGDLELGMQSFPSKEELEPFTAHPDFPTLAGVYIEALGVYIGSRKAIEDQALGAANTLRNESLRGRIQKLARVADGAMRSSDYTHYFNAGSSLAIYDMELAGLIALNGDERTRAAASNWFMSARDKQGVPSLMMSPLVLTPMENRLGEYYLTLGRNADAYEAYQEGLKRYPNNMDSLLGLKRCLDVMGKTNEAALVQRHIDLIKVKR